MRSAKEVGTVTAWPSPLSAPLRYAWASVYLSILVFCMKEWPQDQERRCTEGTQHTVWHSVSYYNSPCDLNNQNDHFSFPSHFSFPGIYEKSLQEHLKFPTLGCKFLLKTRRPFPQFSRSSPWWRQPSPCSSELPGQRFPLGMRQGVALSPRPKKQEFYHKSLGASERRVAFSCLQKCI